MNNTNSLAHTKWNCKYHIVFAPKYRRKVFFGEKRREIGKILRQLCEWKKVNIVEAEVCSDHIHMLLEIPPKIAVSSFVGYLKGKSSLTIYVELPAEQISAFWADDFLMYLESVPTRIRSAPYRPLDEIEKFECVDKDIILIASRVITSHYEESPFVFSLYFSLMMNPCRAETGKIIAKYKNDIPLLEEIYLKSVAYSTHEDNDGHFLAEIILNDPGFLYCYLDKILEETFHLYGSPDEWLSRLEFIWTDDTFSFYMDLISDYIFEKTEGGRWIYCSIVGQMLLHKHGESGVAEKQEKWIQDTIEKHCLDRQRMYRLFSAIVEHSANRRRNALDKLLKLNSDYTLFEKLPLEASSWGGCGSMIPHMQERITYLSSLMPLLSGVEYLKHKQKVEYDIEIWRNRIKSEEIRELLESLD